MTPALLFPLGLAALASVLVPLAIHLARRTEQQPTDFAALRWLRQKPRPRHRPRFDERLLLAVRLLLLAVLALALAEPVLRGSGDARAVVAVVPGAELPPAGEARRVWLAPGFPPTDEPAPRAPLPVGSLVRQLDAALPPGAPLTVVVPRVIDGADAERPRVSRTVTWRGTDGAMPAPPAATATVPALRAGAVAGARYLRAAVAALGGRDIAGLAAPLPRGDLIWLAPGALPNAVRRHAAAGATVLVGAATVVPAGAAVPAWQDATGAVLVEARPLGRGRLLRFATALTPATLPALAEPDFPRRLQALFAGAAPEPGRVPAAAYAPLPGAAAPPPPVRDLSAWPALSAALLFAAERWLATRRRRAVAP